VGAIGTDQALVHELVDEYHDQCVRKCFDAGNRYRSMSFDFARYKELMHEAIDPQLPAP